MSGARQLALLALLVALAPASPAQAHALLRVSDPPDGARLAASPSDVRLTFTEAPEPGLSSLRVLDAEGAEVAQDARPVPGEPDALVAPVPDLSEGVYTITWRVVSRIDGHLTGGVVTFGVGVSPLQVDVADVQVPPTPEASTREVAGRWALFLGLGLLVGVGWVGAAAFRSTPMRVVRLGAAAGAPALIGLALLALAQREAAGVGLGTLLATPVGAALSRRALAIAAAVGLVLMAHGRGRLRRPLLALAGVASALAMLVHVGAGHAAAGEGAWVRVGTQWVHVVAASVWLGGLAALLVGVRGDPDEERARAVARFSAVAAFALAAVALTGVLRVAHEVGGWGPLITTGYGRLTLVKAALLVGLGILGARNRYRNVPNARTSLGGLRRLGRVELAVAVVAVGAGAALASFVPPRSITGPVARPAAIVVANSDFATTVRARLEVDPGLPGPNRFELRLRDFDTGEPIEDARVTLRFTSPTGGPVVELSLDREGDRFSAVGSAVSRDGVWEVEVLAQRAGDALSIPLRVATLCETRALEAQGRPTIHLLERRAGGSVEGYVLPLGGDRYEVHFTVLSADGREEAIRGRPVFTAWRAGEDPVALAARPLSRGHYLAEATLDPAAWRFDLHAAVRGGEVAGCFEEELGATS